MLSKKGENWRFSHRFTGAFIREMVEVGEYNQ